MRFKELHVRVGLFAVSLLAMLWGYQLMLMRHVPNVFNEPLEDMSYGWYIPLFSLYVLWQERRKIVESLGKPSVIGLLFVLPSLLVGFLGIRGLQVRFEILGFI